MSEWITFHLAATTSPTLQTIDPNRCSFQCALYPHEKGRGRWSHNSPCLPEALAGKRGFSDSQSQAARVSGPVITGTASEAAEIMICDYSASFPSLEDSTEYQLVRPSFFSFFSQDLLVFFFSFFLFFFFPPAYQHHKTKLVMIYFC